MSRGISWLDFKLGARMLVKSPGLTVVGGIGMAVAIAIGAASFSFFHSHLYPRIPLDEGDRLVGVENWDVQRNNEERRSIHDLAVWRTELSTIPEVGAFRTLERNLILPGGGAEPISLAEMTASGFRIARVRPLLGRYLADQDELPGAAPVAVLGYTEWRNRFHGDPAVIGRPMRLGGVVHTIVGVMPEGFAFPVNHTLWTALRTDPSPYARGEGPVLFAFGRLAPGVSMAEAQAELATVGRRAAAGFPESHGHLRPMVHPYTYPLIDIQGISLWEVGMMQLTMSLFLVIVAANVAILVYARTATRLSEIAVRTALGASRRRILGQLFAEALLLSLGAAAAGLGIAQLGLRMGNAVMEQEIGGSAPFWTDYSVRGSTVAYVVGMAVFAALVVGVLPALSVTGRALQTSLRALGGGTGLRLGRTWTALVIAQVALAVAGLPLAAGMGLTQVRGVATRPTFRADEIFAAGLILDPPSEGVPATEEARIARRAAFSRLRDAVETRLESEPGIEGVTWAAGAPGGESPAYIERDGAVGVRHRVGTNLVAPDLFATFQTPVVAGRGLGSGDLVSGATAVLVNRTFVQRVLGGRAPVGARFRYPEQEDAEDLPPADRWFEVVGVVGDLHANGMDPEALDPVVYRPLVPGEGAAALLAVRVSGTAPRALGTRIREITASIQPDLRLTELRSLDGIGRQARLAVRMIGVAMGLVTLAVLLLSAGGIYALMSFTVAQRRREIGIRSALGAHPRRLMASVFSRSAVQLAGGVVAGVAAAALLNLSAGGELLSGSALLLIPAVALLMSGVGLLAALGPARRGLAIQPVEALRAE